MLFCSAIEIGDEEASVFHVEAIFNPFNREGQKFASIMSVRRSGINHVILTSFSLPL